MSSVGLISLGRPRRLLAHPLEDLHGLLALERRRAGQDLVQDGPESVDIGPLIDLVKQTAGLLGSHEPRSSQELPVHRAFGTSPRVELEPSSRCIRFATCRCQGRIRIQGVLLRGKSSGLAIRTAESEGVRRLSTRPGLARRDRSDLFRDPPIEHDDLAEVAQDDVLPLEIAVDDASRMGISDGMADAQKRIQQLDQPDRVGRSGHPLLVVGTRCLAERAAPDEPHGVKGNGATAHLVDRDDARMFELGRDLRLVEKPRADGRIVQRVGTQLLEGDLPSERPVPRHPDLSHATLGVQASSRIAIGSLVLGDLRRRDDFIIPSQGNRPGQL